MTVREFLKSIRLNLGQVVVIVSNALVVFGWGMRIDNTVGNLAEDVAAVEADVVHIHAEVDDLNIRSAVLEERVGTLSPNGGGDYD
jgi:hypothetical protein